MKVMELIDCTFRDGGYHTDWHFELNLVNRYLQELKGSGISNIELGFRSPISNNTFGPHAFTSEGYLSTLSIPSGINLGVMINAKEFIENGKVDLKLLRNIFPEQSSLINFVRIATDIEDFENSLTLRDELRRFGFNVHINLMKASRLAQFEPHEFRDLNDLISMSDLEVLTLADTYGSLTPKSTAQVMGAFTQACGAAIGVHMHDNMGLALANTVSALSSGAQYVDSTISGMGRGPGNLRTEFLQNILSEGNINFDRLLALAAQSFEELKNYHNWGASSLYFMAAIKNIHPTYVQELCSGTQYDVKDVLSILEKLEKEDSSNFSLDLLSSFHVGSKIESLPIQSKIQTLQPNWCKNKDILLVGSGASLETMSDSLNIALKNLGTDCKVVSINLKPKIDASLVDFFIIVDGLKFAIDSKNNLVTSPIISPEEYADDDNSLIYSPNMSTGTNLDLEAISRLTHGYNTLYYALSALIYGGASKIYLLGFDGYPTDINRQHLNQDVLDLFANNKLCEIYISTPSSYRGDMRSIFSII
jgi:4-hydroxy 2-oxovalerate aldolase